MPRGLVALAGRQDLYHGRGVLVAVGDPQAGRPLPAPSTTQWLDAEETVRTRWRALVTVRQHPNR
ncbi:hypothetical protein ABZW30_13095 [Kitasatospora sp. NPDC004669]|uniref:hypothetical protein n=1 Tax=Kitasatospora sp. NPDC004669 TaxID=3154555 RepID=UPI0033A10D23